MSWTPPKGWNFGPLGTHIEEIATPIGSLPLEQARPFENLRGVSNRDGIIDPPFERIRPIKDPRRYVILDVGYFAYNPMRINVGSIGLVRDVSQRGKISPDYVVFKTRPSLLPELLFRWIKSPLAHDLIDRSTSGAVRQRLYFADLARLPFPLPPLQEQRRIVSMLDEAEALQALRQQADRKAADLIPALFYETFGDPTTNPKKWPVVSTGEVALACDYGTSQKANEDGAGVIVLRMNNVSTSGVLDLRSLKHVELPAAELVKQQLLPGDVLFNRTNSRDLVGKTGLWDGRFQAVAASNFIRLRFDPLREHPQHFVCFMNTPQMKEKLAGMGAARSAKRTSMARNSAISDSLYPRFPCKQSSPPPSPTFGRCRTAKPPPGNAWTTSSPPSSTPPSAANCNLRRGRWRSQIRAFVASCRDPESYWRKHTMKKEGICRFCEQHRKLINAHIFPESFYRPILDKGETPMLYSTREEAYPRKVPIGIYDDGILCEACEKIMGPYDDYARKILFDTPMKRVGDGRVRMLDAYDYPLLKLFFLTLLWRAGVSTQHLFEQVSLGPHEARLRSMIEKREPGAADDYSVVVMTFDDPVTQEIGLQAFRAKKQIGRNLYRFNVAGFAFFIKVDSREMAGTFRQVMLKLGEPLYIVERPWENSTEYRDFMHVVANATESRSSSKS